MFKDVSALARCDTTTTMRCPRRRVSIALPSAFSPSASRLALGSSRTMKRGLPNTALGTRVYLGGSGWRIEARPAGEEQLDRVLRYDDSPTEPQVRQIAACHELVRVRTRDAEHPARLLDCPHEPILVRLGSVLFVHFILHGVGNWDRVLTPMGK